jgi:hypothetical protein
VAPRLDARQCPGIQEGVAADGYREVVATVLTLHPDGVRDPPHARVVEQHGLDDRLKEVDEIVVPADVRELVRQHGFDLLGGEPGHGGRGKQQHGFQRTDHDRHLNPRRLQQPYVCAEPKPHREAIDGADPCLVGLECIVSNEPACLPPSTGKSNRTDADAGKPTRDQPREPRGGERLTNRTGRDATTGVCTVVRRYPD